MRKITPQYTLDKGVSKIRIKVGESWYNQLFTDMGGAPKGLVTADVMVNGVWRLALVEHKANTWEINILG